MALSNKHFSRVVYLHQNLYSTKLAKMIFCLFVKVSEEMKFGESEELAVKKTLQLTKLVLD